MDVQLAASRDGISWERLGNRDPFIPNGPPGSLDHGEVNTAISPVLVGDQLWFSPTLERRGAGPRRPGRRYGGLALGAGGPAPIEALTAERGGPRAPEKRSIMGAG